MTDRRPEAAVGRRHLIVLTIVWVAAVALVNPSGDFPVGDDWSYAYTVRALLTEHVWRLTSFSSVPLGPQILWGALFSLPAGFSFEALRMSTLVLAWSGGIAVYRLVRACGSEPVCALLAAAGMLFCPVFFSLAFTFHTDVPFLVVILWACVSTLHHVDRPRARTLWATTALFVAAVLIRHIGITVAIAAGAAIVAGVPDRRRYLDAIVVSGVPIAAFLVFNAYVIDTAPIPLTYYDIGSPNHILRRGTELLFAHGALSFIRTAASWSLHSSVYVGLYLLPLAAVWWPPRWPRRLGAAALTVVILIAPGAFMWWRNHPLPFLPNTLRNAGLGHLAISGVEIWPHTSTPWWGLLTIAAGISAGVVGWRALPARHVWKAPPRARAALVLTAGGLLAYFAPLLMLEGIMDRYLMLPAIFALALLTLAGAFRAAPSRGRLAAAVVLLTTVAAFDVAAVHDFNAFNRARWRAVRDLLAQGVAPERLDGGFEVNRWLTYHQAVTFGEMQEWFHPLENPAAVLSLRTAEGLRVTGTYPFPRWLGSSPGTVYVLRP